MGIKYGCVVVVRAAVSHARQSYKSRNLDNLKTRIVRHFLCLKAYGKVLSIGNLTNAPFTVIRFFSTIPV